MFVQILNKFNINLNLENFPEIYVVSMGPGLFNDSLFTDNLFTSSLFADSLFIDNLATGNTFNHNLPTDETNFRDFFISLQ